MGTRIITTSDISGTEGAAKRYIMVNGQKRTLDLTDSEFHAFIAAQKLFGEVVAVATPVIPRRAVARVKARNAPNPALVREWARVNGYVVGTRGRISARVLAAYGRNV